MAPARSQISFALKRPEHGKDTSNVLASGRSASRTKTPPRRTHRRHHDRSRSKRRERDGRRRRRRHSRARHSSSSSVRKASPARAEADAVTEAAMDVEEAPSVTETVIEPKAESKAEPRVDPGVPWLSFRQFVLSQPLETAKEKGPDQFSNEYKAYDADHKRDCQQRFWAANKERAVLTDSYHPESIRRWSLWRAHRGKQMLDHFLKSLESGHFGKLRLCCTSTKLQEGECAVEATTEPTQITLPAEQLREALCIQQKEHILILDQIPQQVSIWDIHDQLSQLNGFEDACLGGRDFAKDSQAAFVHFSSESDLQAALLSLQDGLELGGTKLKASAAGDETELKALLVPACGARLEEDLKLAMELIRALNLAVAIPDEDAAKVAAAIASVPDAERRLDMYIIYLRQVHNCCFYSGDWCSDPHELRGRVGAGSLRQATKTTAADSPWFSGHIQRIRGLIEKAAQLAKPPPAPPTHNEEPLKSRWVQACQDLTKKEAEDRFRCTRCTKLFRGVNFVEKHIYKLHPEVMKKLEDDIMEEQMKEAYFADPDSASRAQRALIRRG